MNCQLCHSEVKEAALSSVQLNVFIHYLEKDVNGKVTKFAGDTSCSSKKNEN